MAWGQLRVAVAVAPLLLALALVVTAATNTIVMSLPPWALTLNAAAAAGTNAPAPARQPPPQSAHSTVDEQDDLLSWVSRTRDPHNDGFSQPTRHSHDDVFLIVGVKTSVAHGFARRQAIRQTWASTRFVPDGVRVVFLGCKPDLSMYANDHQQRLQDAIALEQRLYGDLLTNELLECQDSFAGLSDKVKAFFHWAATTHAALVFAMVADDDSYLCLDRLVALLRHPSTPSRRFYAGNAACDYCRELGAAHRDPRDKYYIPRGLYPMYMLPPYLSGQHTVVSRDLVHFISRNFNDLRGLGALDDVTLGLWLFATLRVERTWLSEFQSLRYYVSCDHDRLVSLADLSVFATRLIHDNLVHGKRMCVGFDRAKWLKQPRAIASSTSDQNRAATFTWELQYDTALHQVRIAVQVFVRAVSVDFVYVPSHASAEEGLCGRAATLLQEKHYLSAGDDLCARLCDTILLGLDDTTRVNPALAPFVAIAQHNIRRLQLDDGIDKAASIKASTLRVAPTPVKRDVFTAALFPSARGYRVLIECLLVRLNPEMRVLVWDETDAPSRYKLVDIVVTTTEESLTVLGAAIVRAKAAVFVTDEPSSLQLPMAFADSGVVRFKPSHIDGMVSSKTLYVPRASRTFVRTMQYTPTMLLHPQRDNSSSAVERRGLRVIPSCHRPDAVQDLSALLLGLLKAHIDLNPDVAYAYCAGVRQSRFHFDDTVEALRGAKFAIVAQEDGDDGSSGLVMAFLAGVIPIYIGSSSDASEERRQLFNPGAFVDCRPSAIAEECAHRVLQVQASATLYETMRSEPPITDLRAFEEAFSWHPAAVETIVAQGL